MALFGSKKKKTATPVAEKVKGESIVRDLSHVLTQARITEKASMHMADSVYTFNVASDATKRDVLRAVQALYKVTPRMVRVVNIPMKSIRHARTGKMGMKGGGKKAYVYLKKGETITIA